MTIQAALPGAATADLRASPWPTFWIASIAVLLVSIDTTVLYAAFGALRQGFPAASPADLSWVLNAYTVTYAAMLIPAGGLADVHGRKRMFLLGAAIFLLGSGACGAAGSIDMLIAARVVQAVGAALLTRPRDAISRHDQRSERKLSRARSTTPSRKPVRSLMPEFYRESCCKTSVGKRFEP